jgi:hypothetical protein
MLVGEPAHTGGFSTLARSGSPHRLGGESAQKMAGAAVRGFASYATWFPIAHFEQFREVSETSQKIRRRRDVFRAEENTNLNA